MKFKMNIPNTLTMIRIFCTPIMVLMFLLPIANGVGVFVALGIYVLACITDSLDGHIARKYNMITDFGKFMDQIADKFITTTAMILVLFGRGLVTSNWLSIIMLLVVVLRDILIGGIRMVAANKNFVIAADFFGKIKSFFLDVSAMVLMFYVGLKENASLDSIKFVQIIGLTLMIIGVLFTIISCVNYTAKAIKKLTEPEQVVVEKVKEVSKEDEKIESKKDAKAKKLAKDKK